MQKQAALLALLAALAANVAAADGGGNGGPVVGVSEVNGEAALLFGGRGGWQVDSRFLIGGAGYGMGNSDIFVGAEGADGERPHLTLGYGGAHLEFTPGPGRRWRASLHALLGAGSAGLDGGGAEASDGFFVVEPGVDLVYAASESVRLGLGVSYRFVSGVELDGIDDGDVSGPSLLFSVRFGSF